MYSADEALYKKEQKDTTIIINGLTSALKTSQAKLFASEERVRVLSEALQAMIGVTEQMGHMRELKGRLDWYHKLIPIRDKARQALGDSHAIPPK